MDKKIKFSLFLMTFSTSTLLSIVGVIDLIDDYFSVSLFHASVYVGIFALILGITGLFLPSFFSKFGRKRFFIASLLVFVITSFLQIFITDYYIALTLRIIPAFLYSSVVSIALTLIEELSPNDTNKVLLGVSSGTILGLSISTYIGFGWGYQWVNAWIFLINLVALIFIILFVPKFDGKILNRELQIKSAFSLKFIVSALFIFFIGVAVSTTYNYFSIILEDLTQLSISIIPMFLLVNGLASMVGTSFFGHLIHQNPKLAVFIYPITFSVVIFSLANLITIDFDTFFLLMAFGFLDGSMHTVSQYWLTSAVRESPEFANGFYLFINNFNRTIGIFIGGLIVDLGNLYYLFFVSIVLLICSIPFVLFRIRQYPNLI